MEYKTTNRLRVLLLPLVSILTLTFVWQVAFLLFANISIEKDKGHEKNITVVENKIIPLKKIKLLDIRENTLGKDIVKFSKNGTSYEIQWQKVVKSDNIIGEIKKFDDLGINIKSLNIKSEDFNANIKIEGEFEAE